MYGPWLLLAVALVALPAAAPAMALGEAARAASVEGSVVGRLSAGFVRAVRRLLAGETAVASVRAVRSGGRVPAVVVSRGQVATLGGLGSPREWVGLLRCALPPPALA